MFYANMVHSEALYHLYFLENVSLEKQQSIQHAKSALKNLKLMIKNSKKFAPDRTPGRYLLGKYYWLTGEQKKSLKWWRKSIQVGEQLGARPELARTYFEVGRHLQQPDSKYKQLDGLSGEDYLNKAEALFKEMDLQWDLTELEKVRQQLM